MAFGRTRCVEQDAVKAYIFVKAQFRAVAYVRLYARKNGFRKTTFKDVPKPESAFAGALVRNEMRIAFHEGFEDERFAARRRAEVENRMGA